MNNSFQFSLCIIFCLIFIACESENDSSSNPVKNEDISGEYEGKINVTSVGIGTVLYSFERDSSNIFIGYYEGVEFAELSVTGNTFQGEPSSGNTSFSSLSGQLSETGIFFSGSDADGNIVFSFSGNKIEPGTRKTADIVISGNDYLITGESCSEAPLDYITIHNFERIGAPELVSFLSLSFESEPSPGTYNAVSKSTPPSASTFNGDISIQGRFIDIIGGSVEVSSTSQGYEILLDNIVFEPDSVITVVMEGSIACGS
ncbi:hypothetical protein HZR84_06545 [Hyphobacterium sp. CCMP332]|nr:hypothetical protein HZR84_06545 [Hyphobacterium sp. CCMP332]